MGITKTMFSFSLALAAAFLLHSAASTAVNPFCAAAGDKPFCTYLTKNARTWPEAVKNALKEALEKATAGKKIVDGVGKMMPRHAPPQQKKAMTDLCRIAYNDFVIADMKKCIEQVKNKKVAGEINGQDLKYGISWVSFSLCIDGFDESKIPVPPAIKKFDDEIKKLKNTLLAIVEKKP